MLSLNSPLLTYAQRLRRLRYLASGLSLCVLTPLLVLTYLGFQQLQDDAVSGFQREAETLVISANRKFFKRLTLSNTLPVSGFDYYQQVFNPITGQLQQSISALSRLDIERMGMERYIAGLVGYFQYDSEGRFNSPIWPGYLAEDQPERTTSLKNTEELQARWTVATELRQLTRQSKTLQDALAQVESGQGKPFELALDLEDHLIFYRIDASGVQKALQGYLVRRRPYLQEAFMGLLEKRSFAGAVMLTLEHLDGAGRSEHFLFDPSAPGPEQIALLTQPREDLQHTLILSSALSSPYEEYRVKVHAGHIPMTNAMLYSGLFMLVILVVVLVACYGFYRLGVNQLLLAEQRMNFVSSVSHELKTPLTSIRMYAEMLEQGTVITESHKRDYYRFIFAESERLTRLINNILQLANLSHQSDSRQIAYQSAPALMDIVRSKTASMIEKHGFEQRLVLDLPHADDVQVRVDADALAQVVINITDNALKFFTAAKIHDPSRKKIDFTLRRHPDQDGYIQLEIRDYGEGIDASQQSRLFDLFYRAEDELTRTTQGTGIGLALVAELIKAQHGQIEAVNKTPGLAMLMSFQCKCMA